MFAFEELYSQQGFTLPRLRAFMEVAEAGGIAKAVGSDTVTQSKYSRQIGELEDFFGVELLQKRGKTLALTEAGEDLVRVARESLLGIADFKNACEKRPIRFTIGGGATLLQGLIAPQLGKLCDQVPSVSILLRNLRTREVISGLQDLSLDFGLLKKTALPANLAGKRLGDLHYSLYVPKNLIQTGKEPTWSWAIQNLRIACQATEGAAICKQLEQPRTRTKSPFRFAVESETYLEIIRVSTLR